MDLSSSAIQRTWYAIAPDGTEGPVTFQVGLPIEQPDGEWGVRVSLGDIEPTIPFIFGVDGWQAVVLGMRFISARVSDLSERGWHFFWVKGGDSAGPSDLNFD